MLPKCTVRVLQHNCNLSQGDKDKNYPWVCWLAMVAQPLAYRPSERQSQKQDDWKEVLCRYGLVAVWPLAEQSNFGSSAGIFISYRNHWTFEGKGICVQWEQSHHFRCTGNRHGDSRVENTFKARERIKEWTPWSGTADRLLCGENRTELLAGHLSWSLCLCVRFK